MCRCAHCNDYDQRSTLKGVNLKDEGLSSHINLLKFEPVSLQSFSKSWIHVETYLRDGRWQCTELSLA
ncbi:hypothetical protein PSPHG_CDS_0048 [Pseudomonas phage Psxphi15]